MIGIREACLGLGLVSTAAFVAAKVRREQYVLRLSNRLLRMPGRNYYSWLERFHQELRPENYVEIGIFDGRSLALARPPTRAIGIDPAATAVVALKSETQIFPETSDDFFAQHKLDELLYGDRVKLAFIDGLHVFEQALRDFINLEAYCGPSSAIVMHDVVPLDERSQERTRKTTFWTGDVWKVIPCLKYYRPDLEIFTIATSPSGLGVILGLDPSSRVLADAYDEAVQRFKNMSFAEIAGRTDTVLNMVPNDWDIVAARLRAHGVLGNGLENRGLTSLPSFSSVTPPMVMLRKTEG